MTLQDKNDAIVTCPLGHRVPLSKFEEHKSKVDEVPMPSSNGIQFYSEHSQKLLEGQRNKVIKFLQNRCIEYAQGGVYICKPIVGYNKTTYRMTKGEDGEWHCTCQFNTLKKEMCSHICALYEFFARHQRYD